MEHLELTSDLLTGSLERIIKLISQEAKKEGLNFGAIEDLRVCFKMNLFLMFFFLQNTRVKRNKNSLKDEINEAAQIQASKNDKKKNKSTVYFNIFNISIFFIVLLIKTYILYYIIHIYNLEKIIHIYII